MALQKQIMIKFALTSNDALWTARVQEPPHEQSRWLETSWASPVQSPNSDGIKSNKCQTGSFSYLPRLDIN